MEKQDLKKLSKLEVLVAETVARETKNNIIANRLLFSRITALERLLLEHTDITTDQMVTMQCNVQDSADGLNVIVDKKTQAEKGDRVHVKITEDAKGSGNFRINDLGANEFNEDLEGVIIGGCIGEVIPFDYGENKGALTVLAIAKYNNQDVK